MLIHSLATMSVMATLLVTPLFAQGSLKATIPFDFTVGTTHMSAGDYTLTFNVPGTVHVIRDDRSQAAVVLTMSVQARKEPEAGKLVFNRYGDAYFLSQIWSPGYDRGRELFRTKTELEIAKTVDNVRRAAVPASPRGPLSTSR